MSNNNYGNAARYSSTAEFQRIAAELGLYATRGAGAAQGIGSAKRLFAAIEAGEVICVKREEWERLQELDRRERGNREDDAYRMELQRRQDAKRITARRVRGLRETVYRRA